MGLMDLIERGFSEVNSTAFRQVNRVREWWQLPLPAALLNLRAYRDDMRQMNLYDTRAPANGDQAEKVLERLPKHRTYDGSLQDPNDPEMGQVGTRFGRNTPSDVQPEQMPELMTPSPREVSQRLLYRDSFKPAETLNVLAACWIQFENHDWFGHGENNPEEFIDVPIGEDDEWPDGETMRVKATSPDRTRDLEERPAADLRQHRHPLVGRLPDLRLDRGAKPRAARRRGRPDDGRGRPPAQRDEGRPRRRRPHRLLGQLLDRPLAAPHPVRQGAQRHLRPPRGPLPLVGRRAAVPDRAPRQLGADGEDPHGRVDAGDPRQPRARAGDALELVRPAADLGSRPIRPPGHGDDRRHRRLEAVPPRGALLDHRGVRLGLPPAPAASRRLRDPRPPQRRADRRDRLRPAAGARLPALHG